MSQLAYNYKGQRFTPPTEARFWRVRRLREGQRGQLEVVRGADGRPLIVPIDVDVDGFRLAVNDQAGRYRLDALDEHELVLASVDAAYVTVPMPAPRAEADEIDLNDAGAADGGPSTMVRNGLPAVDAARPATVTAPFGTWPALPMPVAMTGTEYLLAEALRGQVQMFQMVTAALANQGATAAAGASAMMGAAAELVRAADGAAMPRRPPPAPPVAPPPSGGAGPSLPPIVLAAPGSVAARNAAPAAADDWEDEGDEVDGNDLDDENNEGTGGEADMFAKVMTLADKVQGVIAPVADVARLVMGGMGGGVRNAAPADEGHDDEEEPSAAPDVAHLRTSHILLIAHELGNDGSLFRRLLMAMAPDDRQAWTDRLCAMALEDAVADVAAKLERIKQRQARRHATATPRGAYDDGGGAEATPDQDDRCEDTDAAPPQSADREAGAPDPDADASGDAGECDDEGDTAGAGDAGVDEVSEAEDGDEQQGPGDDSQAPPSATGSPPSPAGAQAPPPPATVQARMMEIAKHLRVPEILKAQQMITQLGVAERDAWIAKLFTLAPREAAQVVRVELARRAQG